MLKAAAPELSHKAIMGELGKSFREGREEERRKGEAAAGGAAAALGLGTDLVDLCQEMDAAADEPGEAADEAAEAIAALSL